MCLPVARPGVTIQLEIYNDDARLVVKVGPDMAGHGLISVLDMDGTPVRKYAAMPIGDSMRWSASGPSSRVGRNGYCGRMNPALPTSR